MRKKAYISRFFILYLNPISLSIYGFGCYHLAKYFIYKHTNAHLPIAILMFSAMLLWFACCVVFTVRLKLNDKKKELHSKKEVCCKQTLFHVMSVFCVVVFLGITGITLGTLFCSVRYLSFLSI